MMTKTIVCAVLCLFLTQACLARPENSEITQQRKTTSVRTSCIDNLRQVAVGVAGVISSIVHSVTSIFNGLTGAVKCIVSGNIIECEKRVLDGAADNLTVAFEELVRALQAIFSYGVESVKSCVGLNSIQYVEPLLLPFIESYLTSN